MVKYGKIHGKNQPSAVLFKKYGTISWRIGGAAPLQPTL